jgi:hypothetical protein
VSTQKNKILTFSLIGGVLLIGLLSGFSLEKGAEFLPAVHTASAEEQKIQPPVAQVKQNIQGPLTTSFNTLVPTEIPDDEKIGGTAVKTIMIAKNGVEPGWTAVETTRYSLSYLVLPEKRAVNDAIEITVKLFEKGKPVEKATMIWDMAMMKEKGTAGQWKRTGTMKMLSSYVGNGTYMIQDQMFYKIGNFYEIIVDGENIGETIIVPAL